MDLSGKQPLTKWRLNYTFCFVISRKMRTFVLLFRGIYHRQIFPQLFLGPTFHRWISVGKIRRKTRKITGNLKVIVFIYLLFNVSQEDRTVQCVFVYCEKEIFQISVQSLNFFLIKWCYTSQKCRRGVTRLGMVLHKVLHMVLHGCYTLAQWNSRECLKWM